MSISIYTDGACSGNPGVGGWGAVILKNKEAPIFLNGGMDNTTNNQMELIATINSLKHIKFSTNITLYTDSKYVKNGIEKWILKWKINGWKTSNKKPVKNKKLWIELEKQMKRHSINWEWVQGHIGNKYNEQADILAKEYIEQKK